MSGRNLKIAAAVAIGVLLALLILARMRNYFPFIAALATFVIVWLALIPRRGAKKPAARRIGEEEQAVGELDDAAKRLDQLSREAPVPDRPLFRHMSELMGEIRDHHRKNPAHAELTRKFRKHVVGRMVEAVQNYVELAARVGRDQKDRLSQISTQLEGFVPVLEKIDRACLDNDLMALEINVEVLNEQLNRRP